MAERTQDDLVELQRTLYQSRNPTRRWLHTSRRDRIIAAIERAAVPTSLRALEVGPGSGVYLPTLCSLFSQVTALDVEASHIEALRPLAVVRPNLELLHADLIAHEWRERFDLVLCSEVLEHVPDPAHFMRGLANATAPNGILILSTPQPWSMMELTCRMGLSPPMIGLTRLIYREPVLPTGHISLTSRRRVLELFAANRFRVLHSESFGLYIPLLAEFGGDRAVAIAASGERMLTRAQLTWPLWTQLHVVRREAD